MLSDLEFQILLLSLQVAGTALLLMVVPGVVMGWVLARLRFPGKALVDAVVHLPLVLPPVVTGWLLLIACGRHSPIGQLLESWFGWRLVFDWKGAVLAAAVMAFPLLVRSVRLAIELADRDVERAAATCGASPLRVFGTVTLPLAMPGILAGLVLAFARCLGEFGATITLAGNIPGESRTLPVAIWQFTQMPDGDAAVWRLVTLSVLVSVAALVGSEWMARRLGARLGPA
ncbi:MAG TPA: molybdate ABC transporter permease subunit [Planctomycetes bacterium]|jgi:molybdate transport system permease protein|nr:molybdate ABC transporter permease subunit [Planctomycetota bacterium]